MKISVCLASYNGEKYIRAQLESILSQLPEDGELIVSDDGSKDSTPEIVSSFKDERIKFVAGPQKGVVKNFEHLISVAEGDIIFLSDQDDVWEGNKLEKVLKCFEGSSCLCVLHDAEVTDANLETVIPSFFVWRGVHHGVINNILKNSYTGCCMAFRKELKKSILPFPENIEMHDWWIGLVSEKLRASCFLEEKLIKYRRHGENTNSLEGYPLKRKIENRITFIKAVIG